MSSGAVTEKFCIRCSETKPISAFYVVNGKPYTYCKPCKRGMSRARREAFSDEKKKEVAAYLRAWLDANPGYNKAISASRRAANPEKCRASTRKYYRDHPERMKALNKSWVARNRHKTQSYLAMRKARKMSATPLWADREAIENMYVCSRLCTEATGQRYHVDHIVPLYSPLVCGLHVSDNLRVIPASENHSKSNRHWPDMP